MKSFTSTNGPSVTVLAFPRTTLPDPSKRSPSCLMWPFFSSVSLQFIHFWVSCCICSGDKDRYASAGLARNKYIKFAIAFSSLITPRAGHLPGRDVEPVPNIDIGDRNNQRCKRGLVVVPSGFIPNL